MCDRLGALAGRWSPPPPPRWRRRGATPELASAWHVALSASATFSRQIKLARRTGGAGSSHPPRLQPRTPRLCCCGASLESRPISQSRKRAARVERKAGHGGAGRSSGGAAQRRRGAARGAAARNRQGPPARRMLLPLVVKHAQLPTWCSGTLQNAPDSPPHAGRASDNILALKQAATGFMTDYLKAQHMDIEEGAWSGRGAARPAAGAHLTGTRACCLAWILPLPRCCNPHPHSAPTRSIHAPHSGPDGGGGVGRRGRGQQAGGEEEKGGRPQAEAGGAAARAA